MRKRCSTVMQGRHRDVQATRLIDIIGILLVVAGSLQAPDLAHAQALRIATDVWLPYEDISNEQAPGFSTEVIAHVMKSMSIETETRELPWARALNEVFEGKRDALYTAFWTEERAQFCYYPDEPIAQEKWVFFVRTEDASKLSFSSYDELKDRRIGILRGASVTEEFWDFVKQYRNYEEVQTDELNFKKLDRGRIDYVVTSYSNGVMLAREMRLTGRVQPLVSPVIKEDNLYIIFSKKTVPSDFVERFSSKLRAFKNTPPYQVIYQKYFGSGTL